MQKLHCMQHVLLKIEKTKQMFHATPLPSCIHAEVHCMVCAMQSGIDLR